jgi:hypothetical protein
VVKQPPTTSGLKHYQLERKEQIFYLEMPGCTPPTDLLYEFFFPGVNTNVAQMENK